MLLKQKMNKKSEDKLNTYKWDNKKPTAQMLGRWQPFHDGHYALFEEIIKKTGQVCIQIRDVQGVDDNPFDFETVKKKIEERLNPKYEGRFDDTNKMFVKPEKYNFHVTSQDAKTGHQKYIRKLNNGLRVG